MKTLWLVLFLATCVASNLKGESLEKKSTPFSLVSSYDSYSTDLYVIGEDIFPRFQSEGYSIFKSGFGCWALVDFAKPMVKDEWVKKKYNLERLYNLNVNVGVSYDHVLPNIGKMRYRLGIGYIANKSSFGVSSGIAIMKNKMDFTAFGYLSLITVYKSEYPHSIRDDLLQQIYGEHIYIKGFDPNSWYKISLSYKINQYTKFGIIAERFYMYGLFAEYNLKLYGLSSKSCRLRFQAGKGIDATPAFSIGFIKSI